MGDLHYLQPRLRVLSREDTAAKGLSPDHGRVLSEDLPKWQKARNMRREQARKIVALLDDLERAEHCHTATYRAEFEDDHMRRYRDHLLGDVMDALLGIETAVTQMQSMTVAQRRYEREGFDDVA